MSDWNKAQEWELNWHDNCINSLYEEEKQIVYAEKMGLVKTPTPKTPYNYDLQGKSILLKCVNFSEAIVIDPLMNKYPRWVLSRYMESNIAPFESKGEELIKGRTRGVDEVWIYNVLEHCEEPKKIINNAKRIGKIVRLFEWIDTALGINNGHIHSFTEKQLNEWLGGNGKTEMIKRGGANGHAYFGVFKGDNYR
jgi:hypothetical protein